MRSYTGNFICSFQCMPKNREGTWLLELKIPEGSVLQKSLLQKSYSGYKAPSSAQVIGVSHALNVEPSWILFSGQNHLSLFSRILSVNTFFLSEKAIWCYSSVPPQESLPKIASSLMRLLAVEVMHHCDWQYHGLVLPGQGFLHRSLHKSFFYIALLNIQLFSQRHSVKAVWCHFSE